MRFSLKAGVYEKDVLVQKTAHPCLGCGQETPFLIVRPTASLCFFCLMHYTGKGKRPVPHYRTHIVQELGIEARDAVFASEPYQEARRTGRIEDPRVEMEIIDRVLGREHAVDAFARWTGCVIHRSPRFPAIRDPIKNVWSLHDVGRTGVFVYADGSEFVAVLRYPLPAHLSDTMHELIEKFGANFSHLQIRIYAGDNFDEVAEGAYNALARQIELFEHKATPDTVYTARRRHVIEVGTTPRNWAQTVRRVLGDAYRMGASDVHIAPMVVDEEGNVLDIPMTLVKFRIDGYLKEYLRTSDPVALDQIINTLKSMADLPLGRSIEPMDGSFTIVVGHDTVFCRMNIIPLAKAGGEAYESVVIRLLDSKIIYRNPDELGYYGPAARLFFHIAERKARGIIIIAGETGSGKSTSLHILLRRLMQKWPEKNFLSVEQPVEYRQSGLRQVEVDEHHRGFAEMVRAFMRHDPDVILVGEIRDLETANAALQLGITGHLVLTTIHAQSIADILSRLDGYGVDPFYLRSALSALLTQILVRRPCPGCRRRVPIERVIEADLLKLGREAGFKLPAQVLQGEGCPECNFHGHKGRINVMECARIGQHLWEEIRGTDRNLEDIIQAAVLDRGFVPLVEDALAKVQRGDISGTEFEMILNISIPVLEILSRIRSRAPGVRTHTALDS